MDKIESRYLRSQMPGVWATEIRGPSLISTGHRYLCSAQNEGDAAAQAGRVMGDTRGATGFDQYWIEPSQLGDWPIDLPASGALRTVGRPEEWANLMLAHQRSEAEAPGRNFSAP